MKNHLKGLRIALQALINSFPLIGNSRELSIAKTSMQNAKMWLGKCLAASGEENPYPASTDHKSNVIEPAADSTTDSLSDAFEKEGISEDTVAKAKMLRGEIGKCVDWVEKVLSEAMAKAATIAPAAPGIIPDEAKLVRALDVTMQHLEESKMWVGMELGNHFKPVQAEKPVTAEQSKDENTEEKKDLPDPPSTETKAEVVDDVIKE